MISDIGVGQISRTPSVLPHFSYHHHHDLQRVCVFVGGRG